MCVITQKCCLYFHGKERAKNQMLMFIDSLHILNLNLKWDIKIACAVAQTNGVCSTGSMVML